jgi:hypothetical protein
MRRRASATSGSRGTNEREALRHSHRYRRRAARSKPGAGLVRSRSPRYAADVKSLIVAAEIAGTEA